MALLYSEHKEMSEVLLSDINGDRKYTVLDVGANPASLNMVTRKFRYCRIDAACFPGDDTNIASIKAKVSRKNYAIVEKDICAYTDWGKYDYVFANLLSGEADRLGYEYTTLLEGALRVRGTYLIVIDNPEDPDAVFNRIAECCRGGGYELIKEHIVGKDKTHRDGTGKILGSYYKGMLFRLKKTR